MPYLICNIHVSRPFVDGRNSYNRGEAGIGGGTARGGVKGTSTEQRWFRHAPEEGVLVWKAVFANIYFDVTCTATYVISCSDVRCVDA